MLGIKPRKRKGHEVTHKDFWPNPTPNWNDHRMTTAQVYANLGWAREGEGWQQIAEIAKIG
jgi:hypothetical protein